MHPLITQQHVDDYARDGVVPMRGLFSDFVEEIAVGIEMNMADPGPMRRRIRSLAKLAGFSMTIATGAVSRRLPK